MLLPARVGMPLTWCVFMRPPAHSSATSLCCLLQAYAQARICSFAHVFGRAFAQEAQANLTPEGIDNLTASILSAMCSTAAAPATAAQPRQQEQRRLQLVLRHTCM